jgi:hypothetical protein
MVRCDEVQWVRESLVAAADVLADGGDPKLRLANVRARLIWMTRGYMATRRVAAAIVSMQDALQRLEDEPPVTPNDFQPLRQSIAELLKVIDGRPKP